MNSFSQELTFDEGANFGSTLFEAFDVLVRAIVTENALNFRCDFWFVHINTDEAVVSRRRTAK